MGQHTDNPCPRARHDAHVRARQNKKKSQNLFLNKGEYEPGQFEHSKISRP